MAAMLSNNNPLANELEFLQSRLVIEKVIEENHLVYKKILGIIPTKKTGEYWTVKKFLKKNVSFENKKGTSVISISYKSKDKEEAYNIVNSLIASYVELHKEINSEKSKSDKKIIEAEYNKAKSDLSKKVNSASGLPTNTMTGTGNLTAMSAFSRSAQTAMSSLKGQYIAGEKARVDINEDANKVAQLSSKLEWAKLVEEMSDSSKVLVISEPTLPKDWEYSSPKLFINILLGIIFGIIFSLIGVIYKETTDKKLSYSMLGNDIIYNLNKEFKKLKSILYINKQKNIGFVSFEKIPTELLTKLQEFKNMSIKQVDFSENFSENLLNGEKFILFEKINNTDTEDYKLVKQMLEDMNKEIICEILL